MRKLFGFLLKPSMKAPVVVLLLAGVGVGVVSVIVFDFAMASTNTQKFCTSCHEMATGPFVLLQDTTHFNNKSGVGPICSDCHVPREFWPKIWRKILASREVWGMLTGKIDTREKYLDHVAEMKGREVARMMANDSQECRNCHDVERMLLSDQTAKARGFHQTMVQQNMTCIECHQGIAHMSAEVAERL
jgi:cytochrome c-type protein NapC